MLSPSISNRSRNIEKQRDYVCLWHLTDVNADARACPLLGVKRTSPIRALMSANDPKRTSAAQALAAPGAEQYAPAALPPHSTKQSDRVW